MSRVARNFREEKTFLYGLGHSKDFEPSAQTITLQQNPNVAVYSAQDQILIDRNRGKIYRENQCCQALSCAALLGGLSLLGRR